MRADAIHLWIVLEVRLRIMIAGIVALVALSAGVASVRLGSEALTFSTQEQLAGDAWVYTSTGSAAWS